MKKIENIIEGCWHCRHCHRYVSVADEYIGEVRFCGHRDLCTRSDRDRLIQVVGNDSKAIPIPDWCPLETYQEAEKHEAQPEAAPCYIGQSKVDEKVGSTIILPGMPHLEWMTENLQGFGGTEIDGRTYYTYDEAMEAVKQLGDGWRLPTSEEFEQLCDLGSEWQENGPHGLPGRLFGGGLFLDAAGYRSLATGALEHVGTYGYAWSSSSYAAGSAIAGGLGFSSGVVYPLGSSYRAYGFSVRCVRNRQ